MSALMMTPAHSPREVSPHSFQDGTLTDSIAAVEAAWTAKAHELGLEPKAVIAATHGRRASDNLMSLVPNLKPEHVEVEVDRFEKSILAFADTPPLSRKNSMASSRKNSMVSTPLSSISASTMSSMAPMTPLEPPTPRSRQGSMSLGSALSMALTKVQEAEPALGYNETDDSPFDDDDIIDMSVRILPGVRKLMNSLPKGKYAVATSGAKTYCHGCLTRTEIEIPDVCVTADDPRLERGKPFPDPFLLAAKDLGVDPTHSVIFEDSPSGIKAAVAAGSIVIAVCTSHQREQIEGLGAHYIVETMEQVKVEAQASGKLRFTVRY
ncbi:phosphatase [Tremella mesenterica]|uniref:Phosphatase n=1 Tax=Tremella mesenterica TaxID=5217 RepID=A0A4V1M3S0_TREME|nr:phosphatase [Tremella mesenterica]